MRFREDSPEYGTDKPTQIDHEHERRFLFITKPMMLILDPDVSAGASYLYDLLRLRSASHPGCFAGVENLMAFGSIGSDRSITKWMRELKECGYLTVKRRGQGRCNVYTIVVVEQVWANLPPERKEKILRMVDAYGIERSYFEATMALKEPQYRTKRDTNIAFCGGSLNSSTDLNSSTTPPTPSKGDGPSKRRKQPTEHGSLVAKILKAGHELIEQHHDRKMESWNWEHYTGLLSKWITNRPRDQSPEQYALRLLHAWEWAIREVQNGEKAQKHLINLSRDPARFFQVAWLEQCWTEIAEEQVEESWFQGKLEFTDGS